MPRINVAERNQQKITTYYNENEEARKELATRTDVEDTHQKRLRRGSQILHNRQLRLFDTFMRTVMQSDPEPYTTRSDNSKAPDATLLKRYSLFRAQHGVGRVSSKLSVWTVIGELATLTSALLRATSVPISKAARKEVLYYVKDHLTSEMVSEDDRLSSERLIKPVATTADIEILLDTLFTNAAFENLMLSSRDILQLSLFICLMVDCCGRGSDLSYNDKESMDECLKWKDLALYIQNTPSGGMIHGALTMRWLKGTARDPSKYKTIPFTLLPSHMAHCDALRQLLTLGIGDGILPAWSTIEKSMLPTPGATFRFIIPEEKGELPIFRSADIYTRRVTAKPRGRSWFGKHLKILGAAAGFELPVTGYNLRRGSAHYLDLRCTPAMRKFMMSHVDQSHLYHSTYQSRIAALDVGAVFWSAPSRDQEQIDHMIGIAKDRVIGAPTKISVAGERACQMSQENIDNMKEVDRTYKELRAKFDSIPAARNAREGKGDWNEANDYDQAKGQQLKALNRLRKAKLSEERALFRAMQSTLPHKISATSSSAAGIESPTDDVDAMLDTIFVSDDASLLDGLVRDHNHSYDTREWEEDNIEEFGDSNMDDTEFILPNIGDSEMIEQREIGAVDSYPFATDPILPVDARSVTERCHGLLPQPGDVIANEALLSIPRRHAIFNTMTSGAMSATELSDEMVIHFSRLHTDFHFPKIYQPAPGTYNCIHCGFDLSTIRDDAPWEHVHTCANKHHANAYSTLVENTMPASQSCSFAKCKGQDLSTASQAQKIRHHSVHGRRWHDNDPDKRYPCFYGKCLTTTFNSRACWIAHTATEHGHIVECFGFQFCSLCEEWYVGGGQYEMHLESHLNDVLNTIKKVGYNGILSRERVILPKACPFCVHDASLPIEERLLLKRKIQIGSLEIEKHITTHLQVQEENGANRQCPCFESAFCSNADFMDAATLKTHLENVHEVLSSVTFKNGFKREAADDQLGPKKITRAATRMEIDPSNYPGVIQYDDNRCEHCAQSGISQCRIPNGRLQGRAGKQINSEGTLDQRKGSRACEGCHAHRKKCSLVVRPASTDKSTDKNKQDAVDLTEES